MGTSGPVVMVDVSQLTSVSVYSYGFNFGVAAYVLLYSHKLCTD